MNKLPKLERKEFILIAAFLVTLALGIGIGVLFNGGSSLVDDDKTSATAEKKPLFYRNPMNPAITSPVPAQDEMGMDYIPVYADDANDPAEAAGTVRIDPVTVQNIGVRTAIAENRTLSRSIRAVGRIEFDETRLSRLHPKINGWIGKVRVAKTGQRVKKNTILLSIYSPQLVTTQQEYVLALKNKEIMADSPFEDIRRGAEDLLQSVRERLELLDVAKHQIKELEKTRKVKKHLHIHSPFSGIVMKVGIREGQHVTPKTQLYLIADLSRVWVYANVYDYELPWITLGDSAEMRLASVPGKIFKGKVTYIFPYAESRTRTIKVRLEFANPKGDLRPDMFSDITINASKQVNALVVPSEAIIRSGTREQVFVVRGPGKFEPREVRLGITSGGQTQILEGIVAGEKVVTSAQFLIDSESKLREATAKMLEASKKTTPKEQGVKAKKTEPGQNMDRSSGQGMRCGAGQKTKNGMDRSNHKEMKHD